MGKTEEDGSSRGPRDGAALPQFALGAVGLVVLAKLALHVSSLFNYGYFRDELYFLDCARHLDWGYVDHAPLIAVYAKVALLLGGSLPALRWIPAVATAGLIVLTALLAREMGGGRRAQALAALTVLATPIYLVMGSLLTMNAFEPLFWMGAMLVVVRLVRTGDSRLWLVFGALMGLGLENKHSTVFFGLAVVVALVLTRHRAQLVTKWIWLAGALALVLFLPNLLWQAAHGFPTLEDLHNVRVTGKNVVLGPLAFIGQQVLMMNPILLPVWLIGLGSLLAGRLRRFRVAGIVYVTLLALFFLLSGKDYYLAPAYPVLIAAGAVAIAAWIERLARPALRLATEAAVALIVVAAGAISAPLGVPILSPQRFVAYTRWLGVQPPKTEVNHIGRLPQYFGDQFGWPSLVGEVARVYHALPAADRARACILTGNYGEAGAIDLFGPRYGLPKAISGHQTYFFWGPRDCTGQVLITLQYSRDDLEKSCASVEEAGRHSDPWGMAEENGPIYVCRGLSEPLRDLWPEVKHWN